MPASSRTFASSSSASSTLGREAACDHLGLVLRALAVQLRDDDQRAVGRELTAIAQHGVALVAEREAVDELDPDLDLAVAPTEPRSSSSTSPLSEMKMRAGSTPIASARRAWAVEHAPLAVHGDERRWAAEREHRLQLVGGAVARHVHGRDVLVQHGRRPHGSAR